jgi:hypothetical protein
VSIPVPDGTTISGLATLINNSGANPGVTATVLDMGSSYTTDRYRLMLTGQNTGATYTIAVDNGLTTLDGTGGTVDFTSTAFEDPPPKAAQNAQVRLDGYPPGSWIERASNTVTNLIPGVTLSLLSPSSTAVQVTVADDTDAMQQKITDLVSIYNDLLTYIQDQTKYDKTTEEAGVLFGNYGLQIVKSQLGAIATGNAPGFASPQDPFLNLAQIGITTDADEKRGHFLYRPGQGENGGQGRRRQGSAHQQSPRHHCRTERLVEFPGRPGVGHQSFSPLQFHYRPPDQGQPQLGPAGPGRGPGDDPEIAGGLGGSGPAGPAGRTGGKRRGRGSHPPAPSRLSQGVAQICPPAQLSH